MIIETFLDKIKGMKDYSIFNRYQLPETITDFYRKHSSDPGVCKAVFRLIGATSKIKTIQEAYDVKEEIVRTLP